jgi:hypothetical protein
MPLSNRFLVLALACPLLLSCNVYKNFASPGNSVEYIEEAQRCLADGNYDCAIANYSKVTDANTKNEKLCIVNIARAGLGMSALIDVITNSGSGSRVLRNLAEKVMPYSTTKEEAAAASITACALMASSDTATLLKSLSYLVDCGVRVAKTDTLITSVDNGGTTCNSTASGDASGTITATDIGGDPATGVLSVTHPGMCTYDAQQCKSDLLNAQALNGGLSTSGFDSIASNITALSSLYGAATDSLARLAIRTSVQ